MVIYEICERKIPFEGIDIQEKIKNLILSNQKLFITDCPDNIKYIIENGWKLNPNERIDINEMLLKINEENILENIKNIEINITHDFFEIDFDRLINSVPNECVKILKSSINLPKLKKKFLKKLKKENFKLPD
jgi:hypothetical protein